MSYTGLMYEMLRSAKTGDSKSIWKVEKIHMGVNLTFRKLIRF